MPLYAATFRVSALTAEVMSLVTNPEIRSMNHKNDRQSELVILEVLSSFPFSVLLIVEARSSSVCCSTWPALT